MKKQKENPAPAGVAGRISRKDRTQVTTPQVQAIVPFRLIDSLYTAFQKTRMQLVQWKGQVVSVDELIRKDTTMPSCNFVGAPYAFLLLDSLPAAAHATAAENQRQVAQTAG